MNRRRRVSNSTAIRCNCWCSRAISRAAALYGDYIQSRGQTGRLTACRTTANLVRGLGNTGETIVLPEMGIRGNTHLFTQDNNNDEIARMVLRRLENNVRAN